MFFVKLHHVKNNQELYLPSVFNMCIYQVLDMSLISAIIEINEQPGVI